MFVPYVAAFVQTKWGTVDSISTVVPGSLYYARKSGSGTIYAKFLVTERQVRHISDGVRHVLYDVLVEVYAQNPSESTLQDISKALDIQTSSTSSLLAALLAAVGGNISSGSGTPGGKLIYCWRTTPGASDTLATEEERLSGRDVQVIKWGAKLGIQWG